MATKKKAGKKKAGKRKAGKLPGHLSFVKGKKKAGRKVGAGGKKGGVGQNNPP
jgi:hypothetical protein